MSKGTGKKKPEQGQVSPVVKPRRLTKTQINAAVEHYGLPWKRKYSVLHDVAVEEAKAENVARVRAWVDAECLCRDADTREFLVVTLAECDSVPGLEFVERPDFTAWKEQAEQMCEDLKHTLIMNPTANVEEVVKAIEEVQVFKGGIK